MLAFFPREEQQRGFCQKSNHLCWCSASFLLPLWQNFLLLGEIKSGNMRLPLEVKTTREDLVKIDKMTCFWDKVSLKGGHAALELDSVVCLYLCLCFCSPPVCGCSLPEEHLHHCEAAAASHCHWPSWGWKGE